MSETPANAPAEKPRRTMKCKACGEQMPATRGVCPHCGATTTWFKVRTYVGCGALLLGGLAILANLLLALWGPSQQ